MAIKLNTEKSTQMILAVLGIIITLLFILVSMGKADWLQWIALIAGAFLGLVLWTEGAIYAYFKSSGYRKIGFGDIIVWASFVVGAILITQAIFLLNALQNQMPVWLEKFLSVSGITIGILAGILFAYHLYAPRPN